MNKRRNMTHESEIGWLYLWRLATDKCADRTLEAKLYGIKGHFELVK